MCVDARCILRACVHGQLSEVQTVFQLLHLSFVVLMQLVRALTPVRVTALLYGIVRHSWPLYAGSGVTVADSVVMGASHYEHEKPQARPHSATYPHLGIGKARR